MYVAQETLAPLGIYNRSGSSISLWDAPTLNTGAFKQKQMSRSSNIQELYCQ